MFKLYVVTPAEALPCAVVGPRPVEVGRAPASDVLLTDSRVSWHHASIWSDAGKLRIRDAGSRHGTSVDGEPVPGVADVREGSVIRIADRIQLVVRRTSDRAAELPRWRIDDIATGVGTVLRGLATALPGSIVARIDDRGRVRIDGGLVSPLATQIRGRERRLVELPVGVVATTGRLVRWYPYALYVARTAVRCIASLQHGEHSLIYPSGRRGQLLTRLAERLLADRAAAGDSDDMGWCSDEELSCTIWGPEAPRNNLYVLIYRTRRDLARAGFDADVLEKRPGAVRLRVLNVKVEQIGR